MVFVRGRDEIHREKRLIKMLRKSVRRCAASVMTARLWAAYPPAEGYRKETSQFDTTTTTSEASLKWIRLQRWRETSAWWCSITTVASLPPGTTKILGEGLIKNMQPWNYCSLIHDDDATFIPIIRQDNTSLPAHEVRHTLVILPITSPIMKTRLTAQAIRSFLLARCFPSPSARDGSSGSWQQESDWCRSSSSLTDVSKYFSCELETDEHWRQFSFFLGKNHLNFKPERIKRGRTSRDAPHQFQWDVVALNLPALQETRAASVTSSF